ncbi:aflatoxin B1 aldehyde reductase member 2-like [Actinia tenebrosa]|uniref:Aflatoxin B1 aldehyde reductase member 2-like n=1 Tax=Actinia tenebrosa TaxID=6105 RepID=A0A6P8J1B3_ACTTE|nr:aflatoxin B1 aldehyde reductase member 2-like [Actinia tenebrosa]
MKTVFGTMEFGRQADPIQAKEMVKMCMNSDCYEFDTAFMYAGGKSEEIMGTIDLLKDPKVVIATKANPWSEQGLKFDRVLEQMNTSLHRLQRKSVDIFYLHAPDHKTPIEDTLKAVDQLHKEGKFKQFALSNYAAWEVVEIYYICKESNYVLPTIYQGMYNAFVRAVESELFPCLRRFGIQFYAYNPLAGGLLTGKYQYSDKDDKQPFGRFFGTGPWAESYRERFWKKPLFDVLDKLKVKLNEIYGEGKVSPTEASLRWIYHHSLMSEKYGDKVILGASNLVHLEENLKASKQDVLHEDIVKIFDEGWESMKGQCPAYNR